jgi:RNA polymerase sigma factor (sigma-70 family)
VHPFFARRVGREAAGDLTAETFASALVARRRFTPSATPAAGWLHAIAARRLVDLQRRRAIEMRTREALMADAAIGRAGAPATADALAPELDAGLLRHLPPEQRDALRARFAEDRNYAHIAAVAQTSQASIRQRVSRALGTLRAPLQIYRAAQQLAREDRAYRFASGHGKPLGAIGPREPLDCSSATSLLLMRAGVLVPGPAWTSGRFAAEWGKPGEGRYVTVWANQHHVRLEFRLDADHGERFDPTPSRLAPHSGWLTKSSPPAGDATPRHWPGL